MTETKEPKEKPSKPGIGVRTTRYFREVRGEVRKVTWPTRSEATRLTGIVLLATAVMTVILYSFDWLFASILQWSLDVVPNLF
ncbi:MAG: preprotein translocase subunit SecE [Anaerolineae bacterium]|nr:preprotein translocase subunit SecE [Anaerolineae bacterium]